MNADSETAPRKSKHNAPSAPDERDATIQRLERTVAEERQHAATLRETVEGLRFQAEILEKSYAKQLTDARTRSDAAERALADERARLTAFGTGGEDTMRLLTEARAELETITAERDRLRQHVAQRDGVAPHALGHEESASLTINELMRTSSVMFERAPAGESQVQAQVAADQESPVEMLAPELVFTGKSGHDDDE
jgi:hypothetical protein